MFCSPIWRRDGGKGEGAEKRVSLVGASQPVSRIIGRRVGRGYPAPPAALSYTSTFSSCEHGRHGRAEEQSREKRKKKRPARQDTLGVYSWQEADQAGLQPPLSHI